MRVDSDGSTSVDPRPEESAASSPGSRRRRRGKEIPVLGPLWSIYRGFVHNNGFLLSAGIAYYGLFSIAPLMLLTTNLAGLLVGADRAQSELTELLAKYLGDSLAQAVSNLAIQSQSGTALTANIIGAAMLLYGATRLFLRLQTSFNIMWGVSLVPGTGFSWQRLVSRLASFAMILIPSILLFASFVLSSGIKWLADLFETDWLLGVVQSFIPLVIAGLTLLVIFSVLPDARIRWRDCWVGAVVASIVFVLGTRGFGWYLSWSAGHKYYGTVGALMALIVWVDFMAITTLLATRLNRELHARKGREVQPYAYAILAADLSTYYGLSGSSDEADDELSAQDEDTSTDAQGENAEA